MDDAPASRNGDGAVSNTRLYLGNLPRNVTKAAVETHFEAHGAGKITEIKLMNGFGFIEYEDARDARDVVPDGSDFMGERLVVQFARGANRVREDNGFQPRVAPRPRRTVHRMTITNLPFETSWQDLKDFARVAGLDVVYSEVSREREGAGGKGFVEYETAEDLVTAVQELDGKDFKGSVVRCIADTQTEVPRPPRERFRSRSPGGFRGGRGYGGPPPADYDDYYRRGPPRGYSPRRDDYRRRSPPPPRDYYDQRDDRGYGHGPPRRGPPPEDYGRSRYDDRGYAGAPPPPRGYEQDPYANGHGREPYGRPPSPRGYDRGGRDYGRAPYW